MFRRLRRVLETWSFPVAGWLSAVTYLIVAGGVPLPIPDTSTKDSSVAFPCMDSACGCRNANQCWESCCCHTPAERLAWARRHGVMPPQSLIVEVDTIAATPARASCCDDPHRSTCCSKPRPCCLAKGGSNESTRVDASPFPSGNDAIVGLRALACHGFGTDWLAGFVALPPPVLDTDYRPMAVEYVSPLTIQFVSPSFPPPVPPPRPANS